MVYRMNIYPRRPEKNYDLADMARINRMALMCYSACCVFFSVFGYFSYKTALTSRDILVPLFYFGLLWLPLVFSYLIYRDENDSIAMKYVLFVMFGFFYTFVLFAGNDYMFFLFAIPMLVVSIAYYDIKFSVGVSITAVLLNLILASGYFKTSHIRSIREDKFLTVLIIIIIAAFLNFCSYVLTDLQNKKMAEIDSEKDRFKALVSVGIKRIFEYDVEANCFMTARSNEGKYGHEQYIHDFTKTAKQYRYVLFADWFRFDEFINNCQKGMSIIESQMRLRDKAGDYKWFRICGKSVYKEDGTPYKVIGTMENIDETKRMEICQADENMRDPLTKLYRKPYARQLIQEFLKRQLCSEYAGFLILDIDNFAILNEKMGVAFGDEILKNIAADIETIFYPTDVLGRVGGDEFVILMKNIKDISDIEKKIKEIQKVINRTYVGETMNFGSTVGVGASVFPIDGVDFDVLYEKAEKALFHAKEAGKNCYGFYDSTKEDIYKKYRLEEKHEKMRQAELTHDDMQQNASDSLIELAFKLIEESKDTDSAINLLIRQVARQMNLGGICIRERMALSYKVDYPYQCCNIADVNVENTGYMEYNQEQWAKLIEEFRVSNGLLCISDAEKEIDDTRRKIMLAYGVRSCARCAFYDKGEFVGNIDFLDFTTERRWSKEDIITMRAVTNVVSSYLLKMKAYEDASDTVERLTGYDAVTGLYKYEKFLTLTTEFLESAPHGSYAMVYLDFSNFKYINDTYGYEIGDKILKEFADTVRSYKDYYIYGSRVFSDNIVALIHIPKRSQKDIVDAMHHACTEFTKRIKNEYLDSNLVIDIGICPFEINGGPIPIKNIISNANMARKEAKQPDKPRCIIYDESMGEQLRQEITYANDMENAFRNREFVVYMQPKVNLKTNTIDGAEALVRWKKEDGTIIYPNDFIPVFEKNKTITLLDYYVYAEVCKYLSARLKNGEDVVQISVNVSRVHLYSIKQMVSYVKGLLSKYKIPSNLLEFELTETVFTEKVEDTIFLMTELRKLGVKVSMDDFGSGYSSLNVLTKLPIDVLKLDKEFLKDFEKDSEEKIIIPSIIDMARKLNLRVVCEGVETNEQVQFLREVGCDYAQGYYYSRPVPIARFDELLVNSGFKDA